MPNKRRVGKNEGTKIRHGPVDIIPRGIFKPGSTWGLAQLVWKNESSTTRDVNWSSTQRDGGRKGRTNSEIKVRIKRDLVRIA